MADGGHFEDSLLSALGHTIGACLGADRRGRPSGPAVGQTVGACLGADRRGLHALNAVFARTLAAAPAVRIPDLALSLVLEDTVPFTCTTSGSLF